MIQTHTMILWAEPKKEEFEETVTKAYDIMQLLKEFGTEVSPNYLTVYRKKDAKLFEWSYEAFRKVVQEGVNKEGKNIFSDLGYSFSFFSSLIEKDSAGISMNVGVTYPRFNNTLLVDLPQSLPIYDDFQVSEKIIELFKKCVIIFKPFWGCIVNKVNSRRFESYFIDTLPSTMHWINYCNNDITSKLDIQSLDKIPNVLMEKFGDGYFLRLNKSPINDEQIEDIQLQDKINKLLGLQGC